MDISKERKPNGYWTKEKCQEEALKFNSKIDFINNNSIVYYTALKKGWLNDISIHMTELIKIDGYWNDKEKCKEEALKYKSRKEYHDKSSTSFRYAKKNMWLDEICSHMKITRKPIGYWDKEKIHIIALQFNVRTDFKNKYNGAYTVAKNNGWLNDVCSHMKIIGDLYNRLIYIFEFSDKSVYIGLTGNFDRRCFEHLNSDEESAVFKYIKKTGLTPKYNMLSDYISVEEAIKLEIETIEKYKLDGYNLLNTKRGGGLGFFKKK